MNFPPEEALAAVVNMLHHDAMSLDAACRAVSMILSDFGEEEADSLLDREIPLIFSPWGELLTIRPTTTGMSLTLKACDIHGQELSRLASRHLNGYVSFGSFMDLMKRDIPKSVPDWLFLRMADRIHVREVRIMNSVEEKTTFFSQYVFPDDAVYNAAANFSGVEPGQETRIQRETRSSIRRLGSGCFSKIAPGNPIKLYLDIGGYIAMEVLPLSKVIDMDEFLRAFREKKTMPCEAPA